MRELSSFRIRLPRDGDGPDDDLVVRALPVIDAVIRRRCRSWRLAHDVREDLRNESVVRLLKRLRDPDGDPIGGFEEYVAGIATRVIDDLVRTWSPEWSRLKNRFRYVIHHDDRFRVTTLTDGRMACLLESTPSIGRRRVRTRVADRLARVMIDVLGEGDVARAIDDVVSAVAARIGIAAPILTSDGPAIESHAPDPLRSAESSDSMRELWSEIVALSYRQRLALLLHVRDTVGESVLHLMVGEGIVSIKELDKVLEMSGGEIESLWNGLPLPDATIAVRLGVSRQQVINLRRAARDRLARRMARTR